MVKERIAVFAAPDTKARIETSEKYEWAFEGDIDRMLLLVSEGVRVAVIDLTFSWSFKIKSSLQTLGDKCPQLILITRPSTEPTVYGPTLPPEPGNPVYLTYPVDVGNLEIFIKRILELLDVVARVQPKIDEAAKRAEEFEKQTHLKQGDENQRVDI